jgi:hypothetical protein
VAQCRRQCRADSGGIGGRQPRWHRTWAGFDHGCCGAGVEAGLPGPHRDVDVCSSPRGLGWAWLEVSISVAPGIVVVGWRWRSGVVSADGGERVKAG